eukprot:scaffold2177_cov115-Cylindrotheca_fusiformis.AAC.8
MSPLSEIFKAAAATTVKGAGITLASTTASCYLACKIEVKAHQAVYHYFPEKYANVEHANGLTQEQLDAARNAAIVERPEHIVALSTPLEQHHQIASVPPSSREEEMDESSSVNQFWKEEKLSKLAEEFIMPSQDVIACSLTG